MTTSVAVGDLLQAPRTRREIRPGMWLLPDHLDDPGTIWAALAPVIAAAPFRHMITPGGAAMSAAMTSCGSVGWVTDRAGYRYSPVDPVSGRPWPAMPDLLALLARNAAADAGFPGFLPDACLVNRYAPGARMGAHQDRDERDLNQPVVSVSLGLSALFQVKPGTGRTGKSLMLPLYHGDVVVFGGPARLAFHGVAPIETGSHPLTGACRINLTFRQAL